MSISKFQENFYVFDDSRVRQFLIVDETQAVLFDAGFEDTDILNLVRSVTDKPVKVYMTHGDWDHAGGLKYFDECWINKGDNHLIKGNITLHELNEGDTINVGPYSFEVIEIPGHTYGSAAFLDRSKKLLISGDSIQDKGPIYMFGSHRNLDLYIESLKKMQSYLPYIETILSSHHDLAIGPEFIGYCLEDAIALKNGELSGEKHPELPCRVMNGKHTDYLY